MNDTIKSNYLEIKKAKIHYLEAGESATKSLLFLHGASFSAQNWQEIGSLKLLAEKGYRVVAIDLPGYGTSQNKFTSRPEFLRELIEELNLQKPILVSPSMSGGYSLPFIVKYPEKLSGFVPIAPVGIPGFAQQLQGITLPTLAIWGSNDGIVPVAQGDLLLEMMPNARKIILEHAGHACYMRATDEFHKQLLQFTETIFG